MLNSRTPSLPTHANADKQHIAFSFLLVDFLKVKAKIKKLFAATEAVKGALQAPFEISIHQNPDHHPKNRNKTKKSKAKVSRLSGQ